MKNSYALIVLLFIFGFNINTKSLNFSKAQAQNNAMLDYQRARAGITTKLSVPDERGTKSLDENVIKQRVASYSNELKKLSDQELRESYSKFRERHKGALETLNSATKNNREEIVRQMSNFYAASTRYNIARIMNEVGPETPEKKMLESQMKSAAYSKYVTNGFSPVDFDELTRNLKLDNKESKIAKQFSQFGIEGIHLAYDVHIGSTEGTNIAQSTNNELSVQTKLKKLAEFYSAEGKQGQFEKIRMNVGGVIAAVHSPNEMNYLVDDVWDGKQYLVESNSRPEAEKRSVKNFFNANNIKSKSQLIQLLKVNPRKFLSIMSKFSILSIPGAAMAVEAEPAEQIYNPNAQGSNVGNSYLNNLNLKHRDEKTQSIK